MERERLVSFLNRFPALRIAVAGDFFLDKWLEIDRSLDEPSLETGLTAYQVIAQRLYAGAAGTVLSNLAALETGTLYAIGFMGDDGEGFEMLRILHGLGINTEHLPLYREVMTPTYTKPVFLTSDGIEETNRLDHKNTHPTPEKIEDRIIKSIREIAGSVDAIIISDQLACDGYGVITARVRDALAEIGSEYPNLVLYADSRAFINTFRNVIIKCNNLEAVKLFYPGGEAAADLDHVKECLHKLSAHSGRQVFISCGSRGVMTQGAGGQPVLIPAPLLPAGTKIDIVGAGDACTSGIVSALCCGATNEEAAFVGNLVASITIQVIGTTGTATREQLLTQYDAFYGEC
jgi:bifunctional ADP-heptose synthase (sugar kinase/adenylyltransferase)